MYNVLYTYAFTHGYARINHLYVYTIAIVTYSYTRIQDLNVWVHMCFSTFTCMCTQHIHGCEYTFTSASMCMHQHCQCISTASQVVFVCVCVCLSVCLSVFLCVSMGIHVHACMCIHVHACTNSTVICIPQYIKIH